MGAAQCCVNAVLTAHLLPLCSTDVDTGTGVDCLHSLELNLGM